MLSLRVTISLLLYYYHYDYYYCYCSLYLLLLPVGFVHGKVHIAQPLDDVMWGKAPLVRAVLLRAFTWQ